MRLDDTPEEAVVRDEIRAREPGAAASIHSPPTYEQHYERYLTPGDYLSETKVIEWMVGGVDH